MPKAKHRQNGPIFLGSTLASLYANKQWQRAWLLFQLCRDWPLIVGEHVGQLTQPAWFRRDVLWISVQNSAWMHHMQFIKGDLLERINQVAQAEPVADIRCFLEEPVATPKQKMQAVPTGPSHTPEQERAMIEMSKGIADEECQQALQRLWRRFAGGKN